MIKSFYFSLIYSLLFSIVLGLIIYIVESSSFSSSLENQNITITYLAVVIGLIINIIWQHLLLLNHIIPKYRMRVIYSIIITGIPGFFLFLFEIMYRSQFTYILPLVITINNILLLILFWNSFVISNSTPSTSPEREVDDK